MERREDGTLAGRFPRGLRAATIAVGSVVLARQGYTPADLSVLLTGGIPNFIENALRLSPMVEAAVSGTGLYAANAAMTVATKHGMQAAARAKAPTSPEVEAWRAGADAIGARRLVGNIPDEKLRALVDELAPLVTMDTGWPLDTAKVEIEIVDNEEGMRSAVADALERVAGVEHEEAKGWKAELAEKFASKAILGIYLPTQGKVLMMRDGMMSATGDAVREVLYHELIHAAQHQNFPTYFEGVAQAARAHQEAVSSHGKESHEAKDTMDTLQARMTLIEGHALHLQMVGRAVRFPESKRGVSSQLAGLPLLLSEDGRHKMLQYLTGGGVFSKILENPEAGRTMLGLAYVVPQFADILFKSGGHVKIGVKPDATPEEKQAIQAAAVEFLLKGKKKVSFSIGDDESISLG